MNTAGSRRYNALRRMVGLAVALALAAAACGSSDVETEVATSPPAAAAEEAEGSSEPADTAAPAATETSDDVTPEEAPEATSIVHKYGETIISGQPERVITLGFSEQDPVLALGVTPIAVREWFGGFDYATWPWAQEALADGMPEVLEMPFGELSYETVAALAPDLIVATHGGITEEEYEVLSEIAPTLVETADVPSFGMSWQDQTLMIGEALGLSEEARQQVLVVEAATLDTARTNDDFGNATFAWANPTGEGTYWIVGATTPPMRFLQSLGLVYPDTIGDVVGEADSFELSGEQVSLLDVDVLIVQASDDIKQSIIDDPLWQQLSVMSEDRILWLDSDDPVYGALSFATVLSIDYLLDELPPILTGLAGAPSSTASSEEQAAMNAFAVVFDSTADWSEKEAFLENSANLEESNTAYAAAGDDMGGISLAPSAAVIDGQTATITYDVLFGASAAYNDLSRTVTLVDGTWTVGQNDYCDFLASARTPCTNTGADEAPTTMVDIAADAGAFAFAQFISFSPDVEAAVTGDGSVTVLFTSDAGLGALQDSNPALAGALRTDFDLLDQVLRYHTLAEPRGIVIDELAGRGELDTLLGETITFERDGGDIVLNGGQARVTAADLTADNGILHIIDGVLIPPSRVAEFGQ